MDMQFSIIVIGYDKKERYALVRRIDENKYEDDQEPPMMQVTTKIKEINQKKVNYIISDGESSVIYSYSSYYKSLKGFLLLYDIDDSYTFGSLPSLIEKCRENFSADVIITIVGYEKEQREVSIEEAQELAKKCNVSYFEVNPKTGKNIEECFDEFAKRIFDKFQENVSNDKKEETKNEIKKEEIKKEDDVTIEDSKKENISNNSEKKDENLNNPKKKKKCLIF